MLGRNAQPVRSLSSSSKNMVKRISAEGKPVRISVVPSRTALIESPPRDRAADPMNRFQSAALLSLFLAFAAACGSNGPAASGGGSGGGSAGGRSGGSGGGSAGGTVDLSNLILDVRPLAISGSISLNGQEPIVSNQCENYSSRVSLTARRETRRTCLSPAAPTSRSPLICRRIPIKSRPPRMAMDIPISRPESRPW